MRNAKAVVKILGPIGLSLLVTLWACGRPKYTLPPVGSSVDTQSVKVESGMPNSHEPAMPAFVAAYIRGHGAAIYRAGVKVGCLSDMGPPCVGEVLDSANRPRTILQSDLCAYTNPQGKAHLVIADASFVPFFDESFTLPETFSTIPNEIGDESSKMVFDESCSL